MSYWFFLFAFIFFLTYWISKNQSVRRYLVIGSGIIFQAHFAGPSGVLPMIILSIVTYFAGLSNIKRVQYFAIFICASALIFYKYTIFLTSSLIGLFDPAIASQLTRELTDSVLPSAPPLAISFFVFEFVHYLVDVSWKNQKPIRSPGNFALFALFWPTMVAGPIKRYEQFLPSMDKGSQFVSKEDVAQGMIRLAIGIVKKFTADNLTLWIAFWTGRFDSAPLEIRWLVFIGLGFRILLDFSGYSDMAIGFSRMMGVKVPENFNWPYLATGPIEFWRRWHISLSSWIRDYIYIPLGGNRVSLTRKITNGLIAFAVCGLWHGAGWNFIVWGLYHGIGITVNNLWNERFGHYSVYSWLRIPNRVFCWSLNIFFVFVGWVIFFYDLPKAMTILRLLWGFK